MRVQYEMDCEDLNHPKDLGYMVTIKGPLEFVLGAARNHLRGHPGAIITIERV